MKNILAIAFAVLSLGYLQAQEAPVNQLDKTEQGVNQQNKKHLKHHGKQNFHRGGMQKAHNPELQSAMEKYRKETVMPAMQDEHKTMLKNLSKADRTFLEKKREEFAQLNKKQKALQTAIHTSRKEGLSKEDIQAKFKTQKESLHAERKAFFESMQEFVKRNETNLQSTRENLKTIREKTHIEHKALKAQFKPADAPARPEKKEGEMKRPERKAGEGFESPRGPRPERKEGEMNRPERKEGHMPHHAPKGKHERMHKGKHGPKAKKGQHQANGFIHFLLWNGEAPAQKDLKKAEIAPEATFKTSVYPNPAQTTTTVKIDLPKEAKSVQIRVVDLQGKTVLSQTEKSLAAGEQLIQLNVEKLPAGTYFYNVIADDLKVSSSLIIAK